MNAQEQSNNNFKVIGIGASAGGLEASTSFFSRLEPTGDQAFVLAQHMSPQHRSNLVELIAKETLFKVKSIFDGQEIEPDTIYVNPPNFDIEIIEGQLRLQPPATGIGPKPSVDRLFNSMAFYYRENALGIILSGTGSDGTIGCKAIQDEGGITIAQKPDSAKYDGMPVSAIRARAIDKVLEIDEMVSYLKEIKSSEIIRPNLTTANSKISRISFEQVINKIHEITNIDFKNYKRATLERQLQRRMMALQINDLQSYLSFAINDEEEIKNLQRSFLISVTAFFRDAEAYEALKKTIIDSNVLNSGSEYRVWVPACATGEEAYSIAILLNELVEEIENAPKIRIFATDVDEIALNIARTGTYSSAVVKDLPKPMRAKYFQADSKGYRVNKRLRDMCMFASHNILQDPPFLRINLLSCRNLLIYMDNELQDVVIRNAHYALVSEGLLFLGKSETISGQTLKLFNSAEKTAKIFKRSRYENKYGRFANYAQIINPNKTKSSAIIPQQKIENKAAYNLLIDKFAPPSIILDREFTPIEILGDVSEYISIKSGKSRFDIISLMKPSLQSEIRAILNHISRKDRSHIEHNTMFETSKGVVKLNLTASKVEESGDEIENIILTISEEKPVLAKDETKRTSVEEEFSAREYFELQEELNNTKEHLQAVIEELETSNEELQSINEELQASTEELQASNEELETTNEELQATNEELSTVNDEMQAKSILLSDTVDTLDNIQRALDYGIILVDKHNRITRYTPQVVRLFGIIDDDIGTSILKTPTSLEIEEFEDLLIDVLKSGVTIKREVSRRDDRFLMTISPYKKSQNEINGAVISFLDITELRQREKTVDIIQRQSNAILQPRNNNFLNIIFTGNFEDILLVSHDPSVFPNSDLTDISLALYNEPMRLLEIIAQEDKNKVLLFLRNVNDTELKVKSNLNGKFVVLSKDIVEPTINSLSVKVFK